MSPLYTVKAGRGRSEFIQAGMSLEDAEAKAEHLRGQGWVAEIFDGENKSPRPIDKPETK